MLLSSSTPGDLVVPLVRTSSSIEDAGSRVFGGWKRLRFRSASCLTQRLCSVHALTIKTVLLIIQKVGLEIVLNGHLLEALYK